jgi:glutamate-1-semialdehyde 2,1-aminomutase
VPGCEQVRLVSSGTEAAMTAIRLARGYTGRDRVVKFDGCYHGHSDALLAGGGAAWPRSGSRTRPGCPLAAVADTIVAPYNVVPDLDESWPASSSSRSPPTWASWPPPGFLEGLRAACDEAGALLIFDEVITGFRLGPGGATALVGVSPDLWCFGKVIGGGLPRRGLRRPVEILSVLAPLGPVYQAGTLSGNPLATAAGLAVAGSSGAGSRPGCPGTRGRSARRHLFRAQRRYRL